MTYYAPVARRLWIIGVRKPPTREREGTFILHGLIGLTKHRSDPPPDLLHDCGGWHYSWCRRKQYDSYTRRWCKSWSSSSRLSIMMDAGQYRCHNQLLFSVVDLASTISTYAAVVAFQKGEVAQNSEKIWSSSRWCKVTDLGTNRQRIMRLPISPS